MWNHEYQATQGRPQKTNVSFRRQFPSQKKKRSQTKRKPTARSKNPSAARTTKDLSKRRRQARERQKQAEKRAKKRVKQESNIITFPNQSQQLQPVTGGTSRSRIELSFLLILRLIILAVGIGAIAGTVLSFLDRDKYLAQSSSTPTEVITSASQIKETLFSSQSKLPLKQEVTSLKQTFQTLASQQSQLNPAAFVVDLDSGKYVNLQGESRLSAASMIQLPILIAFFQAWEEGKLRLDEPLTLTQDVKAEGSGKMQNQPVGSEYLALETAAKMIIHNDNTATNMIIKRLGGKEALNQLFAQWGLEDTRLRNPLPDLEGTNTTSPKELVKLLAQLSQGELVSARSRDRIFQIMSKTQNNALLAQGLAQGATISHKTGSISSLVGDVGRIDSHTGKRYFVAVMVERPANNSQARELIRRYSKETYQYFQKQEKNSFIE